MVFDEYARYYDLLYQDKDYQAEADYVAALIRRFHPDAQSILEMGSGTGKHARLLADRGYKVHGIERSPEMLAKSLDALAAVQKESKAKVFPFPRATSELYVFLSNSTLSSLSFMLSVIKPPTKM